MSKIEEIYKYTIDYGQVFVYEKDNKIVGVFGGIITEPIMSTQKIFQELYFAFNSDYSGYAPYLIKYVKNNIDADGIVIAHMSDAGNLDKFYNILGFKPLETHYIWKNKR